MITLTHSYCKSSSLPSFLTCFDLWVRLTCRWRQVKEKNYESGLRYASNLLKPFFCWQIYWFFLSASVVLIIIRLVIICWVWVHLIPISKWLKTVHKDARFNFCFQPSQMPISCSTLFPGMLSHGSIFVDFRRKLTFVLLRYAHDND